MKRMAFGIGVVLLAVLVAYALDRPAGLWGWIRGERFYSGQPAAEWARRLVSDDPRVQERNREALEQGGASAAGVLTDLLVDPRAPVRWTAAEIVGKLGKDAEPLVGQRLAGLAVEDPDPHVRQVA